MSEQFITRQEEENTWVRIHQPFFRTFLVLFYRFFQHSQVSESTTTSDWLNHTVMPISSCVVFKFTNLREKTKNVHENAW